ncbi:MAG: type II toxin-antitoxin system HicA family toxin [Chloroflexi bacterium]|nr:type II toxin-antitoxin system HicA family toxin [Chloroflexota bacterium]
MPSLPLVSGDEFSRALQRAGFEHRRTRGSHMILRHPRGIVVSVPRHRELPRGIMTALLRDAGISRDEFIQLLRRRRRR